METEVLAAAGSTLDPERFRRLEAPLWRYLRLLGADPATADDLVQETFLRALTTGDRRGFQGLRTIGRHLFLDRIRSEARRARAIAWSEDVEQWLVTMPRAFDDSRLDALRDCLGQLGPRSRQALYLRHAEGASQAEVAGALGLGLEGLKALLRRSRAWLRDCIQHKTRGLEA